MPVATLTAEGLVVQRATEIRDGILDDLETYPGVGVIDRDRLDDRVDGQYASIMGDRLGDLGEGLVAVRDARSPNNATGIQLSDLCEITGTFRKAATYSTCTVTLGGSVGLALPAGQIVENSVTGSRWILQDDVTFAAATEDAVVRAEQAGVVTAEAGELSIIVTPITGWTSVTNAGGAVVGKEREADAALRVRRVRELAAPGGGTANAVRANLSKIDAVTAAVVVSNYSPVAATVQGVPLPGSSFAAYVWPNTLSSEEQAEVARVLWERGAAGIEQVGTQSATVTDAAGGTQAVEWSWATEVPLTAAVITVTLLPGTVLSDVEDVIRAAVVGGEDSEGYFDRLSVGDSVIGLELACEIAPLAPGVKSLSFSWDDGTGPVATDYDTDITKIVTLDAANLTVTT